MEATTATFTPGDECSARSLGDHDCIFRFTVVSRTAKFVTLRESDGRERRVGVKTDGRGEYCYPFGRYSLAPLLRPAGA